MFLTCKFEDNVRVLPSELGNKTFEAVQAVLEKSYIDHVIKDVGLAITVYEITSVEGGFIYPSDGAAHFSVAFSLVIFRPLIGEIIVGEVKSCLRYFLIDLQPSEQIYTLQVQQGRGKFWKVILSARQPYLPL